MDSDVLSRAIVAWTGYGVSPSPTRDDARVFDEFGSEVGRSAIPLVHAMEDDFYASEARHVAGNVGEMAQLASADFAKKHPEISADAVQALAWCYGYDHK